MSVEAFVQAAAAGDEGRVALLLNAEIINARWTSTIILHVAAYNMPRSLTALMAAANRGHDRVVQQLLDAGADTDVCWLLTARLCCSTVRLFQGAMRLAVYGGQETTIRLLDRAGVGVNAPDTVGAALSLVCRVGARKSWSSHSVEGRRSWRQARVGGRSSSRCW